MPIDSDMDETNAFASASPDLRFGMLFAGQRDMRRQVQSMEGRLDMLNTTVKTTMKEGFEQFKAALDAQTVELKPIVKQKEIDEALATRSKQRKLDRRDMINMAGGIILAGGVIGGGVMAVVRVFVPSHVVTIAPSVTALVPHHAGSGT